MKIHYIFLFFIFIFRPISAIKNEQKVSIWANKLGNEIWRLGLSLTKAEQLKAQYTAMNVNVRTKNGMEILESAVTSVGRMLARKIDAVKCIYHTAEREAKEFNMREEDKDNLKYCSSKYSERFREETDELDNFLHGEEWRETLPLSAVENIDTYLNMTVHEDSHFYNLKVTTDHSCVHVPTNIYDREHDAAEAILWSEKLDEIFDQNYKSDPSLVWQYFGSSTGILRLFPGMPWNDLTAKKDTFDCRVRSWYIEAATCSKDLIVLFDVSGSMTGSNNYVARNTLDALLRTLSNNDYINVYYFKNGTREVVDCFQDLVQATPENLKTLKEALEPLEDGKSMRVPLEGYANMTIAFIKAFDQLRKYREMRNCGHGRQGCNQLIALITDNVPKNFTDLFLEHNREEMDGNETFIPVRVFTYLIGQEVTNVPETQWTACFNRGYFGHVRSIEDVQQQVLKYINVIARPMILQGEEPPPTWTHAYIDDTRTLNWEPASSDVDKDDSDKLVTSVAIPVFDVKANNNNQTLEAKLLGVAGTDVPIDSIAKLTVPHRLGVNGYSFIVSNNGYLLLHPGLVTSIDRQMQVNYNSVDFVEVEQIDDGLPARVLGEEIKLLREGMVKGDKWRLLNVSVLYHYDQMRRIARVRQNYYYAPLKGTPFSIGISLPDGYGNTFLEVGEPLEAIEKLGRDVTDYFRTSFRIHPDWVYCKHHYLENHETENAEQEIWNFLKAMSKPDWEWNEQYEQNPSDDEEFTFKNRCGDRTKLNAEDYYCNKDLVQVLIFDAKLTDAFYKKWDATFNESNLASIYGVDLRFVATMSGLTRWQYIFDDTKNEKVADDGTRKRNYTGKTFGDLHSKAIEETWYRAAVWQHNISQNSFVFSVPVRSRAEVILGSDEKENITVTASLAIFAKDSNDESSPASVVGFQLDYDRLYERLINMSTNPRTPDSDTDTIVSCEDPDYQCYLVDSSGYMVGSRRFRDVGGFIGVAQPFVTEDMLNRDLFTKLTVYDYQALCTDLHPNATASSNIMKNSIFHMSNLLNWLFTNMMLYLSFWNFQWALATEPDQYDDYTNTSSLPIINQTFEPDKPEEKVKFSCDKEIQLFILNQELLTNEVLSGGGEDCIDSWWATMVPHTNLMLLVVANETSWSCGPAPKIDTDKVPTYESIEQAAPCHKLELGNLDRRRLEGCFTYHPDEKYIIACGKGNRLTMSGFLNIVALSLVAVIRLKMFILS